MSGLGNLGDLGAHAHAEAFADALDGTAAGLLDDTEMLMVIVDRLHDLPGGILAEAGPRPEFRSQLRERLLDEARELAEDGAREHGSRRVVPITSRWTQSWGRRNRTRLVSGLAAGVVGLTAASVAAANSLPGSPFYSLKRDSESLRYTFAGSDEARGKLELGFARTRLHEIDRLTVHDAAWGIAPVSTPQAAGATDTTILATSLNSRVVGLFSDMDAEAAKGSALLARSFAHDPRPGPILAVQQFAKFQEKEIASLRPRLSGQALSSATHSLVWAKAAVKTATIVLQTCGATSCSRDSLAHLTGPLSPAPGAPAASPSTSPSAPSSLAGVPLPGSSQGASPAGQPTVAGPSETTAAPPSPQPTQGQQPTAGPGGTQPSPTDTGGQPTGAPTAGPPTSPTTPPTSPTSPTDSPTGSPTDAPTTPTPSTTPSTVPTTVPTAAPPPSSPDTTLPVPPPPSSAPVTTTDPPSVTPGPPSLTPPPPSAPATSTAAPTTTDAPSGRPPKVCLPPLKLVGGVCVHPGRGPIHN